MNIEKNLKQIKIAVKTNLGGSIPLMADISKHMLTPSNDYIRSKLLLRSADLFKSADKDLIDIASTLEYLHTASILHRKINDPENARRNQKYVENFWGSEASVLLGDYLLSISFKILTRVGNLDILECVSFATQNISRGQIIEISESFLSASPKHWRNVNRYKIAGLFGAGAESAAYWAHASKVTASALFTFGECVGMASQIKTEIEVIDDEKKFQKILKEKELWLPLCFLLHECGKEKDLVEISKKLDNDFESKEMTRELRVLFKKYDLFERLKDQAMKYLIKAAKILDKLEIDSVPLQTLTSYSMI